MAPSVNIASPSSPRLTVLLLNLNDTTTKIYFRGDTRVTARLVRGNENGVKQGGGGKERERGRERQPD